MGSSEILMLTEPAEQSSSIPLEFPCS